MGFTSVIFALIAATAWGITDFAAALASAKIGHFRTAYISQAIGTIAILLISFGSLGLVMRFPLATCMTIGLGLLNVVAVLASYKSFETGKLSLVSPLQSSFPALSTVLAILFLGEEVSATRAAGVVLTLGGIVIVTMQNNSEEIKGSNKSKIDKLGLGLGYAVIAFLAYGFLYFALKIVVIDLGPLIPVLIQRLATVSILAITFSVSRQKTAGDFKSWRSFGLLLVIGLLDVLAGLAYNFGVIGGEVAVVSTISGLYSVVTVLLAIIFLKDRLNRRQAGGILAILVGVGLLGFAG